MQLEILKYLRKLFGSIQKWIEKYLLGGKKSRRIARRRYLLQKKAEKRRFQKLIQLIYYKYGDAKIENPPKEFDRYWGIPWHYWKAQQWIVIFCHPEFLKRQYSSEFLEKMCRFLEKERKQHPEGIEQNFYFALCIAYGFFLDNADDTEPKEEALRTMQSLLIEDPHYQEYAQDLQCWSELIEERRLYTFCREAYLFAKGKGSEEQRVSFAETFLEKAQQWMLMSSFSNMDFVFHNLCRLEQFPFAEALAAKVEECRRLEQMQDEFLQAFTEALDHNNKGNSVHEEGYIPHAQRFHRLKEQYCPDGSWGKLLRSRRFQQAFRDWVMHPRYNTYVSSYPRYLEYYGWREVRSQFASSQYEGSSPYEEELADWLKTSLYFTEYEKRYQREQIWKEQQIEKAYFEEVFPLPERSEKKQEALDKAEQGEPISAETASAVLSELYAYNETALHLLTRATNIMVHFNFLLSRSRDKQNTVWENMICFLEDEVLIYWQKENGTCRLSHAAFFDLISHIVDSKADCHLTQNKSFYNEEFIESVCKNMYLYECFIQRTLKITATES